MHPNWTGKRTSVARHLLVAVASLVMAGPTLAQQMAGSQGASASATAPMASGSYAAGGVEGEGGVSTATPLTTAMGQRTYTPEGYVCEQGYTYDYEVYDTVYYGELEAIFLWRQRLGDLTLATNQSVDTTTGTLGPVNATLDADEVYIPQGTGARLILGRMINRDWSMEFRYWGTVPGQATDTLAAPPATYRESSFLPGGVTTIAGVGGISTYYSSRVNNFEWNIRHWTMLPKNRTLTTYGGIRYISVQEFFQLENSYTQGGSGTAGSGDYNNQNSAYNNLLGFNMGASYESRQFGPISFVLNGDLLLSGNFTSASNHIFTNDYNTDNTTIVTDNGSREVDGLSFSAAMGWGFQMKYQLLSQLWMNFGYEFHLMTGMALASEQLQPFPITTTSGISNSDVLFLHGPSVGITATW